MENPLEFQQCEAKTKSGDRCKRKGIKKAVNTKPKKFLWFFLYTDIVPVYLCSTHYGSWTSGEVELFEE